MRWELATKQPLIIILRRIENPDKIKENIK
jgi:hypothetical protein